MELLLLVFVMRLICARARLPLVLMLSNHQLIFVVMVPVPAVLIIAPRRKASKGALALEILVPVLLVRELVIIQLIIMFGMAVLGQRPLVQIIATNLQLVVVILQSGHTMGVVLVKSVILRQLELIIILLVPAKRIAVV